jgi:hypothetical protein
MIKNNFFKLFIFFTIISTFSLSSKESKLQKLKRKIILKLNKKNILHALISASTVGIFLYSILQNKKLTDSSPAVLLANQKNNLQVLNGITDNELNNAKNQAVATNANNNTQIIESLENAMIPHSNNFDISDPKSSQEEEFAKYLGKFVDSGVNTTINAYSRVASFLFNSFMDVDNTIYGI